MIEIILRQGSQTGTGNMISGRKFSKKIIAALGPTNTGKTHYAVEKMLCHSNGMIGLPLRLLAREVYEKVVKRSGKESVALVTGEERIVPPNPKFQPSVMVFELLAGLPQEPPPR